MKEVASLNESKRENPLKGNITLSYKVLASCALIWLVIPVMLFCASYLNIFPGIILTLIFITILFLAIRKLDDRKFEIPVKYLIAFILLAFFISILSGVGEYIYSLQDHSYRRAILNDLVNYKWPVIYDMSTQTDPQVINITGSSGRAAFCYYFVYWIPAAVAGKIFGNSIAVANLVLMLWTAVGIFLTLVAMSFYSGRATLMSAFFYIFFGGLDVIPYFVHEITEYQDWLWLEGWVPHMSYICNFENLGNVFHQAVPCYLICAMLLISRRPSNLGLGCGLLFCYSPWAVIGILPITIAKIFDKENLKRGVKEIMKDVVSPVNIASVAVLLFVFVPFYLSTSGLSSEKGFTASFYGNIPKFILCYLLLILLEVVPAAAIVFSKKKRDIVYIVSVATLLIIPMFKITYQNDFAMRASMPGLFILAVMVCEASVKAFDKDRENSKNGIKYKLRELVKPAIATLLIILMTFPADHQLLVVVGSTLTGEKGPENVIGSFGNIKAPELAASIKEQFYVEDYEDSFFFRYLA